MICYYILPFCDRDDIIVTRRVIDAHGATESRKLRAASSYGHNSIFFDCLQKAESAPQEVYPTLSSFVHLAVRVLHFLNLGDFRMR